MTLMQFFLAAGFGAALALLMTFVVGLHRDGLLFARRWSSSQIPRRPFIPTAFARARRDQKADLRRVLKGSRVTSWWSS